MPMHLLRSLLLLLAVIVPCSLAAITPDTEKSEAAFFISQLENVDVQNQTIYIIFSRVGAGEKPHFISHICVGSGDPVNRWDPSGLFWKYINGEWVEDSSKRNHPLWAPPEWLTPEILAQLRGPGFRGIAADEYEVADEMIISSSLATAKQNAGVDGLMNFEADFLKISNAKYKRRRRQFDEGFMHEQHTLLQLHYGIFGLAERTRAVADIYNDTNVVGTFAFDFLTIGGRSRQLELRSAFAVNNDADAFLSGSNTNAGFSTAGIAVNVVTLGFGGKLFAGKSLLQGVGIGAGFGTGFAAYDVTADVSSGIDVSFEEGAFRVGTGTVLGGAFAGGARGVSNLFGRYAPRVVSSLVDDVAAISDDALVHFGPERLPTVRTNQGKSFWFRFGEIKNLSPTQIEALIGDMAVSGRSGGVRYMHVMKAADAARATPNLYTLGFTEYTISVGVQPILTIPVIIP